MQVVFNSIYCFSDFDGTFLIIKYLPPFCDVKPYSLCLQKKVKFFFYPEILIDIYLQRRLDWFFCMASDGFCAAFFQMNNPRCANTN